MAKIKVAIQTKSDSDVITEFQTKHHALISFGDINEIIAQKTELNLERSTYRAKQIASSQQLLSSTLKKPISINRTIEGRPSLINELGFISISHCQDNIATIFHISNPVAIDIENRNRNIDRIVSKFTTQEELDRAKRYLPLNPAIFIWSCKECLFKILGVSGVHFKEQLLLKSIDSGETITSKWHVNHPEISGVFKISTKFFDETLCSFIDSRFTDE